MQVRSLIPLIVFVVLVVFLGVGLTLDPKRVPSPLIDKPAPQFTLPRVHDANATISNEDFAGKVAMFNVWASWCVSCRDEHPLLVEFKKHHQTPIYGLNYKDQRADALRWLQHFGDPYEASAYDVDGRVGIDWGVYGVPETFIVDRKGIIRYKHIGPISPNALQQTIIPLLKKLESEAG